MKILVTGSEGSLMQAAIPYLLKQGDEVVGADNFVRYGKIARKRDYEFIEGDLADIQFVKKIMNGVDGVIQAAARIYGVGGFHKYSADILSHDLTLHQNILWTAVNNKIKKVSYVSSSMVYERCENYPTKEEEAFEAPIPLTDYALSKIVGERLCRAFHKQYGLKHVTWRPFNIITPFEKGEGEQGISHVFADFIKMIVMDKLNPLPILGDGKQIRCFTWLEDVAKTIANYSFKEITDQKTYNLGNPEPMTMIELANLIYKEAQDLSLLPKGKPLSFKTARSFEDDVKRRVPDVTRAKKELGWSPSMKVKEAVRKCLSNIEKVYNA